MRIELENSIPYPTVLQTFSFSPPLPPFPLKKGKKEEKKKRREGITGFFEASKPMQLKKKEYIGAKGKRGDFPIFYFQVCSLKQKKLPRFLYNGIVRIHFPRKPPFPIPPKHFPPFRGLCPIVGHKKAKQDYLKHAEVGRASLKCMLGFPWAGFSGLWEIPHTF